MADLRAVKSDARRAGCWWAANLNAVDRRDALEIVRDAVAVVGQRAGVAGHRGRERRLLAANDETEATELKFTALKAGCGSCRAGEKYEGTGIVGAADLKRAGLGQAPSQDLSHVVRNYCSTSTRTSSVPEQTCRLTRDGS